MVVNNTLNIGKLMRDNSGSCRVSQEAVIEMISYLMAYIPSAMVTLGEYARNKKRNTIFSEDVIELFSNMDNKIIPNE